VGFICSHGFNGFRFIINYVCQTKNAGCTAVDTFYYCLSHFYPYFDLYDGIHVMIELIARLRSKTVEPQAGFTILDLAIKHEIPWLFSCTHGTCARCRCLVSAGLDLLNEPTEAELDRLEPEELEQGYRLACQTKVIKDGHVKVKNVPYF
jgi:ferredoxin, 2Fe-2S